VGVWGGLDVNAEPPSEIAPVTGEFRRLRGGTDVLYVVDETPRNGKIQVLDLSHTSANDQGVELPRLRELAAPRLMAYDGDVTGEQMKLIGLWWTDRRRVSRDIAVGELKTGRLTPVTLADILDRTNLRPFVPNWTGDMTVGVKLTTHSLQRPGTGAAMAELVDRFKKFLEENQVDGIDIEVNNETTTLSWKRGV
jgi:hypothetical protein